MPDNAGRDPYDGASEDNRLRYSRRAVLVGLLGVGTLVGFRAPLELLSQRSSSAGEDTGKDADQRAGATEDAEDESGRSSDRDNQEDSREKSGPEREEEPPPPEDPTLALYIPRLGIRAHTVREGNSEEFMAIGAMKLPNTGNPWQEGANPYIAGHRIGYPGTESRYQFYNLPAMRKGDAVSLTDANGALYEYRVIEKFAVRPSESWVTEPVAGKDLVTLQTCTDSVARSTWWDITPKLMEAGPDTGRLIVRAERV